MRKILLFVFMSSFIFVACNSKGGNADSKTTNEVVEKENKPTPPKSEGPMRVLFVGNSHTEYFASFPQMLDALSKENGKNVEVLTLIEMGVGIDEILQANQSKADKMFAEVDSDGNYIDFVILQESTPIAITEVETYKNNTKNIRDLATKNSPDIATYVYQLMSPFEYGSADFKEYQKILFDNVETVSKTLPNSGILKFATVLANAYDGNEGYIAMVNGKDMLRHNDRSHHMLNDAVFLNSIVLYQQLFGETPVIPQQLPLATGINDNDRIIVMDVSKGVSNPDALLQIAKSYK